MYYGLKSTFSLGKNCADLLPNVWKEKTRGVMQITDGWGTYRERNIWDVAYEGMHDKNRGTDDKYIKNL